jgi:hypothetical protein
MPTNRRFRKSQSRGRVTEAQWAYLLDDRERSKQLDAWEEFMLGAPHDNYAALRLLWNAYREQILEVWIREFPGTRPSAWWKFDAPRIALGTWPGCFWDGKLPEPRLKLSGSGIPSWDAGWAILPHFELGIATSWVHVLGDDPPVFESQASYLKRTGLLTASEQKSLPAIAFEPEVMADLCNDGMNAFVEEHESQNDYGKERKGETQ